MFDYLYDMLYDYTSDPKESNRINFVHEYNATDDCLRHAFELHLIQENDYFEVISELHEIYKQYWNFKCNHKNEV